MTEPTITCPKCKTEIKLTESLVAPLIESTRTPISRKSIQEKLECSRSTVGRTIEDTRDFLGAPIKYNRQLNGYQYDIDGQNVFELPGLWFNASEIGEANKWLADEEWHPEQKSRHWKTVVLN